ncbi:MAG: hypothetical protein K5906_03845 [Bacilli bacterium]|nr:hypothetical protein [Bacilli bacterium]
MLVISGASASGKTEVAHIIAKKYGLTRVITVTTREKRVGEVDGVDYFFVSKEEFEDLIKNNKLVEFAIYNGNYYGSRKDQIADDHILVVEANGLKAYIALNDPNIVTFALTANAKIREERMKCRGDKECDIEKRLKSDRTVFSKTNLRGVNFFIENNTSTLDDLADDIYIKYISKLNK